MTENPIAMIKCHWGIFFFFFAAENFFKAYGSNIGSLLITEKQ